MPNPGHLSCRSIGTSPFSVVSLQQHRDVRRGALVAKIYMLTLLDINRAIDRLGVGAFAPRTLRVRLADVRPPILRCLPATVEVTSRPHRLGQEDRRSSRYWLDGL